ncbi:uncharacterized protein METZ01_LOCUS170421, partial [marine metagenome]
GEHPPGSAAPGPGTAPSCRRCRTDRGRGTIEL